MVLPRRYSSCRPGRKPFIRKKTLITAVMKENGLARLKDETLKIYMMVENPSNVLLGKEFAKRFGCHFKRH
jgi:hypothetical protein